MLTFFCLALVMLVPLVSGVHAAIPTDALVLYYTFDENAGDVVVDHSGNGNGGVINGAAWGSGKYGSALVFDMATKTYVEVADSPALNPETEITYMAWFVSDTYDISRGIISKYTGAGSQRSYNLRLHHTIAGALSTEISSNGVYQLGTSTTDVHSDAVLVNGQWHHAAITFKAEDFLRMYVDGQLVGESQATATAFIFDNETPMRIGTDFNDEDKRFFNGSIDEVAVFDRALTQAEVVEAMQGNLLGQATPVEAVGKLAVTWGQVRNQ